MANSQGKTSPIEQLGTTIATAINLGTAATQVAANAVRSTGETIGPVAQQWVEQGTEAIGKLVTPIAEHPLMKYAAKVPGLNLLMAALGHVDLVQAQSDVDRLRQEHPLETPEQLAHRIIVDTAAKAAGIGLLANVIPPFALTLFAVDIAAVTALQAEMVYRIAAAYGFPLTDPARRGEVLGIFGLSLGGSGVLKVGLGLVELLPGIGAVVGASSDAALLYSLGYAARRFYDTKRNPLVSVTAIEIKDA